MSIDKFMQDVNNITWSAKAAKEKGIITDAVYSGILSGVINPMEVLPPDYLERKLHRIGGLNESYR